MCSIGCVLFGPYFVQSPRHNVGDPYTLWASPSFCFSLVGVLPLARGACTLPRRLQRHE